MAITKATASSIAPAAKGDLVVGSATNDAAVLAVGANGTTLVADSSTATGLKWATPSSGGMTLINTGGTALTGATFTISSIPSTYTNLLLMVKASYATVGADEFMRFNTDTGNNYAYHNCNATNSTVQGGGANAQNLIGIGGVTALTGQQEKGYAFYYIYRYTDTGGVQMQGSKYSATSGSQLVNWNYNAVYYGSSAINSISLFPNSGTYSGGTAYLYGVQ